MTRVYETDHRQVRCRPNSVAGQACQRCAKLQLSCVYDRTHKRITKRRQVPLVYLYYGDSSKRDHKLVLPFKGQFRAVLTLDHLHLTPGISKLELLEQELKSIKEVVNPRNGGEHPWSPPTPQTSNAVFLPEQNGRSGSASTTVVLPTVTPLDSALAQPQPQPAPATFQDLGPTSSRILNDKLVTGEDVDWYFEKTSTSGGCPPPFLQHNDAQCKKATEETLAPELMALFDIQKFTNRLHLAMAAQVAAHGGVTEEAVKIWEADLEALKPFVSRADTDCSRFILLSAQLEVQSYYFASPPGAPRPNFPFNALRTYNTTQALLTVALTLESHSKFLSHGPHWIYRTVIDSGSILISTLSSTAVPPSVTPADAEAIMLQIRTAVHSCVVREGDLPSRGLAIIEAFWSVRNMLPKSLVPAGAWPERLGGAVTYWCLTRFRDALQEAKKNTEGVNKGLEAFHGPSAPTNTGMDQTMGGQDPFQDVDWSMFMDEFGWGGDEAVFLGPA
ncbi:hypothetical protein QQX98_006737 [Neonectria punicea]|uniref:Zn(2)-C6 fungal-type domain-containing protein n=1 Tax=Neonectria punicea TaxID=979145 RepID=A0ABR1GZX8_9HYPO